MIIDTLRRITCDAPGCEKAITYDRKEEKGVIEKPENAWLRTSRGVQAADGRNFTYCSDACELAGTATGKHNMAEPKTIVPGSESGVAAAALQANAARRADASVRAIPGNKVQLTD